MSIFPLLLLAANRFYGTSKWGKKLGFASKQEFYLSGFRLLIGTVFFTSRSQKEVACSHMSAETETCPVF
jgi:hypothetical protein